MLIFCLKEKTHKCVHFQENRNISLNGTNEARNYYEGQPIRITDHLWVKGKFDKPCQLPLKSK